MPELSIDNRTLIPVRLIPFVTGWKLSPDVVVKMLAKSDKWNRVFIPSFHLSPDNTGNGMGCLPPIKRSVGIGRAKTKPWRPSRHVRNQAG